MPKYYLVGGAVRDELLGIKSKDIDFAVEADSYEEMRDDILAQGMTIFQERPEYFSIRARHPKLGGVDYTLCRKEGFYSDSRHPDDVQIGTIYDDLSRRDFTVNAVAIDNSTGEYIDPHNGIKDIEDGVLRCVGSTEDRFTEDPLRILRAMRFKITKDFILSTDIEHFLESYSYANLILSLPVERIYEELKKCYEGDTWETINFFKKNRFLELLIFYNLGLKLEPVIAPVAQ